MKAQARRIDRKYPHLHSDALLFTALAGGSLVGVPVQTLHNELSRRGCSCCKYRPTTMRVSQ